MNKFFVLFLALFPVLLFGEDSAMNFNPPVQDYSVVFLGNVFGVVEGVLHGSSQMLGTMFAVFNSAVMALGSILIMYTLIVGTMNTAHEGQFLGQKWASIWVPMRSVAGMGLLVPQASGYCIMQIFVMWVVVQGVGAADKVWTAALNYLNRGGVIVQQQQTMSFTTMNAITPIAKGATVILQGQICMLSLQHILNALRDKLKETATQKKYGVCYKPEGVFKNFCENPVPDLISTVNAVRFQTDIDKGQPPTDTNYHYALPMPNPDPASGYAALKGVCGTIKWINFAAAYAGTFKHLLPYGQSAPKGQADKMISISADNLETAKQSRSIAIQQMYVDLSMVATAIVANNPYISQLKNAINNLNNATNTPIGLTSNTPAPVIPNLVIQQFGVPQTDQGLVCSSNDDSCTSWGADPNLPGSALFTGTEFQSAILDYNAVMSPTLRLLDATAKAESAQGARNFISAAQQRGWILAGSYFFDLAKLNAQGTGINMIDGDTGLNFSISPIEAIKEVISSSLNCTPGQDPIQCACGGSKYKDLCEWFSGKSESLDIVMGSITGKPLVGFSAPIEAQANLQKALVGPDAATVNGFISNSLMVHLPGQPGMNPPQFKMKFNMTISPGALNLPAISFPCGYVFFIGCIGRALADLFYNLLIRNIFDIFLNLIQSVVNNLFMALISIPLLSLSTMFLNAVAMIQQPAVNPIIALSNMGVTYINFAAELWISMTMLTVAGTLIPVFGLAVLPIIMCIMPLIGAWLGMMVAIGFLTAYYVPFLPYMIFTFASIGWLMAVIEAMVAAPIVALGVCFPEGHEAFGKSEAAFMILLNVFLRPTMMIIGFIAAIIMTYVAVWIINSGFSNAILFMQGDPTGPTYSVGSNIQDSAATRAGHIGLDTGYTGWAGVFGFFMAILLYTTMYITVVQEAFNLITALPDKVLRWIGGQAESIGGETAKWAEQSKGQLEKAGAETAKASGQMGDAAQKKVVGAAAKFKQGGGAGNVDASKA